MTKHKTPLAVELDGVTKEYILHHEKPTLMESLLSGNYRQRFVALNNLTLKIKQGEHLGIIGPNGSGKTTLLKIISQIAAPSKGRVRIKGKVVSLIDLQAGFHPELTGEENVYMNALLLGLPRDEVKKKFKSIIDFADIGQFVDAPLYTYSSGMILRLGFSVAISTDPDILVLDEMMSVGDQEFQQKTTHYIKEILGKDKTVIMVNHNLAVFSQVTCDRVIWLENGVVHKEGETGAVIGEYVETYIKPKNTGNEK